MAKHPPLVKDVLREPVVSVRQTRGGLRPGDKLVTELRVPPSLRANNESDWRTIFEDEDTEHTERERPAEPERQRPAEYVDVPLLSGAAAGAPMLADPEQDEETISLPRSIVGWGDGALFMVLTRGDSMDGAGILDGDWVVARRQVTAADGDLVVAVIADETTVKYLSRQGDDIRLLPANQNYEPIEGAQVELLGRVTTVIRTYGNGSRRSMEAHNSS